MEGVGPDAEEHSTEDSTGNDTTGDSTDDFFLTHGKYSFQLEAFPRPLQVLLYSF